MINSDKAFAAFKEKYDAMSSKEQELYLKEMGFSFNPQSVIQEIPPVVGKMVACGRPKIKSQKAKIVLQAKKKNQSNRRFFAKRYK